MREDFVLHIIMPMAGEGRRFREQGYNVPKPLIEVDGVEIYKRAVSSIARCIDDNIKLKYTFVVREEFILEHDIDKHIQSNFLDANVVSVAQTTKGALDTVMRAEKYIDDNDNILLLDCDLEIICPEYFNIICDKILNNNITSPLALSFTSHLNKYSYAVCDKKEYNILYNVLETYEKNVMSEHALAGCYFFGNGSVFKTLASCLIKDFDNGKLNYKECYVSLLYNYYIKRALPVSLYAMDKETDKVISYGTPEEFGNNLII